MLSDRRWGIRGVLNSIEFAAVGANEIVERSVAGHVDVNQRTDASREARSSRVARAAGHTNESAAVIAEKVAARVLRREIRDGWPVERGANDRAVRAGVLIGVDRIANVGDSRRSVAFGRWPTEVRAGHCMIHFLPCVLPDIVHVHATVRGVNSE